MVAAAVTHLNGGGFDGVARELSSSDGKACRKTPTETHTHGILLSGDKTEKEWGNPVIYEDDL